MRNVYRSFLFVWSIVVRILRCALLYESAHCSIVLLTASSNTPVYLPCSQPVPVPLYTCPALSQSQYPYISALLSASPSTPIYLPSSQPVPVPLYICPTLSQSQYSNIPAQPSTIPSTPIYLPSSQPVPVPYISALLSASPSNPIYLPSSQPVPVSLYICPTLSQSHYSYICALLSTSSSIPTQYICPALSQSQYPYVYLSYSRPVPVLVYTSICSAFSQSQYSYMSVLSARPSNPNSMSEIQK
jgi:hypothetical protein